MAITAHAFMTGLISSPLFLLVIFLKAPGTIDLDNPVATNLAAFLPDDSAKWLVALLKSFDVFTFWTLILLAIGFAATNSEKAQRRKALRDCVRRVGRVCGLPRGIRVRLLLIHSQGEFFV